MNFSEDRLCGGRPAEWTGVTIVSGDVGLDAFDELAYPAERSAPNRLLRDESEPPLDLVEPGGVRRSEVHVETRPPGQPGLDLSVLMRGVVVEHQMHIKRLGDVSFHMGRKKDKNS